ncbi:MAG: hypothetical protein IPP71_16985 [Bacteroidetes bacterium]|nr:hypothetical protein [Bacteroidota bacterium]
MAVSFKLWIDYLPLTHRHRLQLNANEIVFVGYGITDSLSGWDDYKDKDVSGKVVLILDGEPVNKKGIAPSFREKRKQVNGKTTG